MCRVKAIASSVERLLRYTNCSGSSEAGSTEQMCSLHIFIQFLTSLGEYSYFISIPELLIWPLGGLRHGLGISTGPVAN